ncbi:MAB_1171c family putative transporter [Mycobacterium attenuatum]|uniref:MAB_1171c family putative transporter n=1 Tax=Mycobacterium attenuatum TaxID=2341086 RepID=UPI000F02884E|nr:hypothetical protein LAUMK41_05692 [Mycobacterium attenuatum]
MPFAVTYGSVAALAITAFTWRLNLAIRNPHSSPLWAVAVAIACAAIGFEAAVPSIYQWIGRISGIPNLATLIVYSAVTTAVLANIVWTSYLVTPGPPISTSLVSNPRRIILVNLAVVSAMAILFFASPVHSQSHPTDFDYYYATIGIVDVFLAVYLCAYTFGLLRLIMLCVHWIPRVHRQIWLRRGLTLLAVGSAIAIGYSIGKAIAITAAWAGISMHSLNITIAPAFASLGAALMLVGFVCPSLIPQCSGAARQLWALYRLRVLWSDLGDALPDNTRTIPTMRRSIRTRLYRRVIEIRDALLILQPHLRPETTTRAEQLATTLHITTSKQGAAIEAARIAAALHAHRSGWATTDGAEVFYQPDQLSFTGEVRWLAAVATAYRTCPLVPALLGELGPDFGHLA